MITKEKISKAIKIVCQNQALPMDALDKQLFMTLSVYKRRGELHGSMKSAIERLKLAGYEIEE